MPRRISRRLVWSDKPPSRRLSLVCTLHVLVALANLPAWIEDGGQQGVEIGPLVGGEIGADVAALVEYSQTGGAARR